uniref:Uncharacterized protein n=1 Tax=Anguilla anguilla TaxID=7936 RepID=A0A0E9XS96_ANGAN
MCYNFVFLCLVPSVLPSLCRYSTLQIMLYLF